MKFDFTLTELDLLNHQLFATSKSKRIMKRRTQGKLFLLIIYLAIGIFIWERNGVVTGAVFFLVCMPLYFIYAAMERKQYVKHIGAYVAEQFKTRGNRHTSIEFGDQNLMMKDGEHESVVPFLEMEAIYETGTLYSISLKNGQGILIPKTHTTDIDDVSSALEQFADRQGILFRRELNWKWR